MTALYASGRCKLHGGMSTGAKTPEGKARQLYGFRRWLERQRQATSQGDNTQ
ncbi:HGGxSTG domain-containing protein [Klebsiella michiganensis]|nr:HGGxSTG domain-containing protein [Klebsiella michiganensis]